MEENIQVETEDNAEDFNAGITEQRISGLNAKWLPVDGLVVNENKKSSQALNSLVNNFPSEFRGEQRDLGELIGDNNGNVGALNEGEILSNYGDSVTKLKVPRECPNEIFRRRLEDIDMELKKVWGNG